MHMGPCSLLKSIFLEIVTVDAFDEVGFLRGNTHTVFDHQFSQALTVYKDDVLSICKFSGF